MLSTLPTVWKFLVHRIKPWSLLGNTNAVKTTGSSQAGLYCSMSPFGELAEMVQSVVENCVML